MNAANHDTLVYRLAQMLVKLNQGEKLDPQALADEFGVNLRTVQRDLNQRFASLPLIKTNGRYHLEPTFLGKLSARDIERFASLAGVRGLFPSLSDDFLRDIFDTRIQTALFVKGHHYESLAGKETLFRQLEQAIVARYHVSFDYQKAECTKHYTAVAPYKLVNHKGIWYLAGRDADRLKTFTSAKSNTFGNSIANLNPPLPSTRRSPKKMRMWLGEEKKEIVLKIASTVAGYFKRRKLIANQIIEKELEDGGLIVSAEVGHPD